MDGISFGGIYDAFDSFERQMEEGLADIFDEDDPPSVAVAASATQSFGSMSDTIATSMVSSIRSPLYLNLSRLLRKNPVSRTRKTLTLDVEGGRR